MLDLPDKTQRTDINPSLTGPLDICLKNEGYPIAPTNNKIASERNPRIAVSESKNRRKKLRQFLTFDIAGVATVL